MASARKPCSAATTCAPSPIAPPTRLTEPERTSPTANTPGTEVSSGEAELPVLLLALRAGDDEAAAVDHHAAAGQPVGGGVGADEQEQVADIEVLHIIRREAAAPAHARQRGIVIAFKANHFGVEHQFDIVGAPRCARSDSATCWPRARRRE